MDPDVRPNKGATKALSAIDSLGGLPNLDLMPHTRAPAVVRAARKVSREPRTTGHGWG